MNWYAFGWLTAGIIYGSAFLDAPMWLQATVGMSLGVIAGATRRTSNR